MINDLDFEGGDELRRPRSRRRPDRALRDAADAAGVPVIYVNDNFGQWHAERSAIVTHSGGRGARRALIPRDSDYFLVKPQFSGFYATNLPCCCRNCVSASPDRVPGDTVASESDDHRRWALAIMRHNMAAETRPTTELALTDWLSRDRDRTLAHGASLP